jgi:hypothetical protein
MKFLFKNLKNQKILSFCLSFFVCIFFIGAKMPKNILSHQAMVEIIVDLELAKSLSHSYIYTPEESVEIYRKNVFHIYASHKISSEIFLESYHYYLNHPKLLLAVYYDVVEHLQDLL